MITITVLRGNASVTATEHIAKRKLSGEVFERLKHLITEGGLRPGAVMPSERELMVRFGVGRPAIREAMQQLEAMGLVEINHGERARVLELTPQSLMKQVDQSARIMLSLSADSLDHLKSARLFFERGMVREAALKASDADIAQLRQILAEQRAALDDAPRFMAADMRFHTRIAAISQNPIFTAVSESMLGWLKLYHSELLIWSGKENFTLAEHEDIITHLAAHNPDAAEAAMVKHLERSSGLYMKGKGHGRG
jgi:GntR family transcriptional regulator, sialic acid-inducible nan operon repressor